MANYLMNWQFGSDVFTRSYKIIRSKQVINLNIEIDTHTKIYYQHLIFDK